MTKCFVVSGDQGEHAGVVVECCEIGEWVGTRWDKSNRLLRPLECSVDIASREVHEHASVCQPQLVLPAPVGCRRESVQGFFEPTCFVLVLQDDLSPERRSANLPRLCGHFGSLEPTPGDQSVVGEVCPTSRDEFGTGSQVSRR